jgi:hypothetical protein
MTETIKMLSMENETLREDNDELVKKVKAANSADGNSGFPGKPGGELNKSWLLQYCNA